LATHRNAVANLSRLQVVHNASRSNTRLLHVEKHWPNDKLEIILRSDATLADFPRLVLEQQHGDKTLRPISARQIGRNSYRWVRDVGHLGEEIEAIRVVAEQLDGGRVTLREKLPVRIVYPGEARRITDLHPQCEVDFAAGSLFSAVAIRMQNFDPEKLPLGPELHPAGACVAVESRSAALNQRVPVRMLPTHPVVDKTGLFYVGRSGNLQFLSAERDETGALVGKARYLTIFAELMDRTPPSLRRFRKLQGTSQLQFYVSDDGAGLADGSIQVHIDDVLAIPEWDPETGKVSVHPFRRLPPGRHEMQVRVIDQVGNQSERKWPFKLP